MSQKLSKLTMIRMFGFIVFKATAHPAIKPPPPTGITTASTSGTCSIISKPVFKKNYEKIKSILQTVEEHKQKDFKSSYPLFQLRPKYWDDRIR